MTVKIATLTLALQDVQVDPFVADKNLLLLRQLETDLLRAPVLAQQAVNPAPTPRADAELGFGMAAVCRQPVACLGIAFQATVALHLPADRGFVNADDGGDLCLAMRGFHQGVNLISLFLVSCV